ncbi:methyltransferase family protein [Rhodothermus marinus]|mgnify:CR=1 FL=1|jgi:protein-S-isoprenylcysteine O-methyltransferase Ste14|uniref:Isoprenylcysteine carboxyl methyltransferase n=1 Tax=Rhodothermus marinus (strain ATCC 43812 / DSM 4252 / R-10) TaxID=518766 RepID=D0MIW2_RHOM4|nr:isoprenylcysteine carboxylmethyltransferase family protein [Rhodothermus marinus]ACY48420.1 isoprenylcysteine carboxyl methyltransferase [Rhodothermus marinus DSM 4252]AEN73513.1 isoprenylcysteine carboxyl methyltransferase [Rhodothermus marinus SG0.5JP17-172]MBO2491192.1 isoprenylcysteine carboxylmethyltransferase family protein [Rhodothermus marinus]
MERAYDYGLWPLVVVSSLIFILFAISFTRPQSRYDWRALGAFSAFVVALFTEMYGVPLTLYLLSGWLTTRYPQLDLFAHENGHLWQTLFGIQGDAHFSALHLISYGLIGGGMWLIATAWRVLYAAQRMGTLATTGPYAYLRHPQYTGFLLVLLGFLIQWPTLLTLLMFPILVFMYLRLARLEEQYLHQQFGAAYATYAAQVPAFLPRPGRRYRPESSF